MNELADELLERILEVTEEDQFGGLSFYEVIGVLEAAKQAYFSTPTDEEDPVDNGQKNDGTNVISFRKP